MNYNFKPNCWVARATDTTTQLSYALQTTPETLMVSTTGALLEFVISNPGTVALTVNEVDFTIAVGTGAACLTPTTAGIGAIPSDTTDWIIKTPSTTTNGNAVFRLLPAAGAATLAGGASVTVQLSNIQISSTAGNSTITINENVNGTPNSTSFLVTIFPASFYLDGLAASVKTGSGWVPVAQVDSGNAVTLTWNSSVTELDSINLYYSNADGQQTGILDTIGEWTSPLLTCDTVFTVEVTTSVTDGQPLSASMSIVVSVQNPTLLVEQITTTNATVNGNLAVPSGTVAMLGSYGEQYIQPAIPAMANTDGFILVIFWPIPSSTIELILTIGTSDLSITLSSATCNVATIPVPANTGWHYISPGYNAANAGFTIYWLSIGAGGQLSQPPTPNAGTTTEALAPPALATAPTMANTRLANATSFIQKLEGAVGKTFDADTKEELVSLLKNM